MKLLVTGDRNWTDKEFIFTELDAIARELPILYLIEGCARGVDSIAEEWATRKAILIEHYPADWDHYGKAAGAIRNKQMLDEGKPDLIAAFHPDLQASRGTRNMVELGRSAGVEVRLFDRGSA